MWLQIFQWASALYWDCSSPPKISNNVLKNCHCDSAPGWKWPWIQSSKRVHWSHTHQINQNSSRLPLLYQHQARSEPQTRSSIIFKTLKDLNQAWKHLKINGFTIITKGWSSVYLTSVLTKCLNNQNDQKREHSRTCLTEQNQTSTSDKNKARGIRVIWGGGHWGGSPSILVSQHLSSGHKGPSSSCLLRGLWKQQLHFQGDRKRLQRWPKRPSAFSSLHLQVPPSPQSQKHSEGQRSSRFTSPHSAGRPSRSTSGTVSFVTALNIETWFQHGLFAVLFICGSFLLLSNFKGTAFNTRCCEGEWKAAGTFPTHFLAQQEHQDS